MSSRPCRLLGYAVVIGYFSTPVIGSILEEGLLPFVHDFSRTIGLLLAVNIAFGLVCWPIGWLWRRVSAAVPR